MIRDRGSNYTAAFDAVLAGAAAGDLPGGLVVAVVAEHDVVAADRAPIVSPSAGTSAI
jgi:hypothetical protein